MERVKKQETQDMLLTSSILSPFQDSKKESEDMPSAMSVTVVNGMWSGMRFCAVERISPKIKAYLCLQLCPFKLEHHCSECSLLCAVVST